MRKEINRRVVAGLLLGSTCILLLVNRATVVTSASAFWPNDGEAAHPLNARSNQSGSQTEKNPFVSALEKKIAGQENKPAEEVFKNIQLLKGMPAGRILRVMEVAFNTSLGVDCTHCHIPEQWEKDDKEAKQTARKMWQFMGKLNQDLKAAIGKGQINCTTCHRGQVKPAMSMPSSK